MKTGLALTAIFLAMMAFDTVYLNAQLSITTPGVPVLQNFTTLQRAGTGHAASGGIFDEGWSFLETGGSANLTYQAGAGTSNVGDTYSFGVGGVNPVTDRAFGLLQTGSLESILGFRFTNNTGGVISSLVLSYTGEVWRQNLTGDLLSFSYQPADVALDAPLGWKPVPGLHFTTPVSGSPAAVDGNLSANRVVIGPVTITGLYIPNGGTVTLRWVDATGSNSAGMCIDDFSITLLPASNDYYRTTASGDWNTTGTWERSADGLNWLPATTTVPTDLATSITVRTGHTITVSSDLTVSKLLLQPDAKIVWTGGVLTVTDSPGDDLVLSGANSVLELATANAPALSGASVRIGTGAVLLLSGSPNSLLYQGTAYRYANGAIFEYTHSSLPAVTGTFFTNQDAGAVPVFRYNSGNAGSAGSSGATVINGKLEIAPGRTLNLNGVSGSLTIRNGITGNGNFSSATTVLLSGPTAEIGGTGTISSHVQIEGGCTTQLTSGKTFSTGRTITTNGVLDLNAWQLQTQSGSANFTVGATGTVRTANAAGLFSSTGSLRSGNFSLNVLAGATIDYNAMGDQLVTIHPSPPLSKLPPASTSREALLFK